MNDQLMWVLYAIAGLLGLMFAVATIAMPFMVWGLHTMVGQLREDLMAIRELIAADRAPPPR